MLKEPTDYVIQSNNGFEYPGFDIAWMGSVRDKQTNYKYDEMFFESKEAAEEFLIMKKHVLSLEEILEIISKSFRYRDSKKELINKIKSKLSIIQINE